MNDKREVRFRESLLPQDLSAFADILLRSGLFTEEERAIAVELGQDYIDKGVKSDYRFVILEPFADEAPSTGGGGCLGFTCYGRIPCTMASYDLYWIALDPVLHGQGLGRALLIKTEEAIRAMGGQRLYADTSARPAYAPTRGFYEACGFSREALLVDFYAPGDGKLIFGKVL